MQAEQIRRTFLDFFEKKAHSVVPSAPIVVKNDPTLMFTNAGMNQFKDIFLGNQEPKHHRIANTQKCLRVSGKHNDLEEVGVDTYHHTMFEMLGNWSFGDYFKQEAINWALELLHDVFGISSDRLYATVFEGDAADGLEKDTESIELWKKHLPESRILQCSRKDNFWEMGETGPCGPCSEIHVDLRSDEARKKVDGASLVNQDHPQVIEVWNLVFIQFNRRTDGKLVDLPAKHVDTGMGFERLCMVLQGKQSNYDTDLFALSVSSVESMSGIGYGEDEKTDIAIRVIVDHIRAVSFAIADGQIPGNTGAGYVIRRILRRAVRYGYSFLGMREPFLHQLVPVLAGQFDRVFPELAEQEETVRKVVLEEEQSFLRTLSSGLKRLQQIEEEASASGRIDGRTAFELYDTYGFPLDLTRLIATERGLHVDEEGFDKAMAAQKARSRAAADQETSEWTVVATADLPVFVGYEALEADAKLLMHREIKQKKKSLLQVVLDRTPFYAESGGQVGDTGVLEIGNDRIKVLDTKKENELIVHLVDRLPANSELPVRAHVDIEKRTLTESNHSATHLLHAALQRILGDHVQQKGSYVGPDRLRFDFSHFSKVSDEEIAAIEAMVNAQIRKNVPIDEQRDLAIDDALEQGATALFGEKYGERVRMITFDPEYSRELCGGTHVDATGQIGQFKIVAESAIAAGIRRIEAVSGATAESWTNERLHLLEQLRAKLRNPGDPMRGLDDLLAENSNLRKEVEGYAKAHLADLRQRLAESSHQKDGVEWIVARVDVSSADMLKQLSFDLRERAPSTALVLGTEVDGKALLSIALSDALVDRGWNAGQVVREAAKAIRGGGGGQPHYATAGGKNPEGLQEALDRAVDLLAAAEV